MKMFSLCRQSHYLSFSWQYIYSLFWRLKKKTFILASHLTQQKSQSPCCVSNGHPLALDLVSCLSSLYPCDGPCCLSEAHPTSTLGRLRLLNLQPRKLFPQCCVMPSITSFNLSQVSPPQRPPEIKPRPLSSPTRCCARSLLHFYPQHLAPSDRHFPVYFLSPRWLSPPRIQPPEEQEGRSGEGCYFVLESLSST